MIILAVTLKHMPSASPVAQMVKNLPVMPVIDPWFGKIPWGREWLPTPVFLPGKSHEQRTLVWSMGSQRVRHD